ncbi:hypothetical protein NP493_350g01041 [Ridgeia piscesae]|uniref:Monocarboxylate transporter n=1 Tax=Ridgeia piscesae TaxID=27915 RepID=A0AAD9L3S0_RIDPI|nr:hypothetical protein NP493_350g01041 [Ridgeia piscesae]
MYLPQRSRNLGITPIDGAFLISIINVTNTVSRVLVGWMTDMPRVDCVCISSAMMTLGGVATMLSPMCTTYTLLAVYAAVYGMCIASFISLQSIIIVDLMGLDALTNAFGLMCLFKGAGCYVGPPLAGWLCDMFPGRQAAFYLSGSVMAVAGLLSFSLRRLANRRKERIIHVWSSPDMVPMQEYAIPMIELHRASSSTQASQSHG